MNKKNTFIVFSNTKYFLSYLGAVFSGISCVEVFASLIGSAVFNPIYSKTNTFMHGFVYLTISVCQFIAVMLVL